MGLGEVLGECKQTQGRRHLRPDENVVLLVGLLSTIESGQRAFFTDE